MNPDKCKNKYILDLARTFDLPMNEELVKLWVNNLSKFDEDILKVGWGELMQIIIPGKIPELHRAILIFERHRTEMSEKISIENYRKEKDFINEKPNSYASKICQGILESLQKAWQLNGGKRMYHKHQAEFWAEMGDKMMENKHKKMGEK